MNSSQFLLLAGGILFFTNLVFPFLQLSSIFNIRLLLKVKSNDGNMMNNKKFNRHSMKEYHGKSYINNFVKQCATV